MLKLFHSDADARRSHLFATKGLISSTNKVGRRANLFIHYPQFLSRRSLKSASVFLQRFYSHAGKCSWGILTALATIN